MGRNIVIIADTSNLHYKVGARWGGRLAYKKYYDYCSDIGTVVAARAFVTHESNGNKNFIDCLRRFGYDVIIKPEHSRRFINLDVCVAGNILKTAYESLFEGNIPIDTIIIGSASPELIPIIQEIKLLNIKVIVIASHIPVSIQEIVDEFVEIPRSMVEVVKVKQSKPEVAIATVPDATE